MVTNHCGMNNQKINIRKVYEDGLCTGCGTCAGICSKNAIVMKINWSKGIYEPIIDDAKCNNCGVCYKACPGHGVDFIDLSEFIFGKQAEDTRLGNYSNCYAGYSTDGNLRFNSSSGGLVTQVLIFALKEGIIDGALVTRMKKDRPLEPEPFIARTEEEIMASSGSKFSPVAVNVALKEILNAKKDEKFAFVGLPCHIQGVRKAEKLHKELKGKIVLHLGLFCDSGVPSFTGIEYFMKQMGIKVKEIKRIDYRRGEFPPGMMRIEHEKITQVDHLRFWNTIFRLPFVFIPQRCILCCDSRADLADVSFGSWWWGLGGENKTEKSDLTAVICRNDIGNKIMNVAKEKTKINLIKIDGKVFSGFKCSDLKKSDLTKLFILKHMHKKVPDYNLRSTKTNFVCFVKSIFFYLELALASRKYLHGLLSLYIMTKRYTVGLICQAAVKIKIKRLLNHNEHGQAIF